jgi:hypothetical protein
MPTTDEILMQKFAAVFLTSLLGFATACVVVGAAVSMVMH